MKVILLKDFKKLGKENDIINVSDGYANNYLIPNKIAVIYNSENQNTLKLKLETIEHNQEKLFKELEHAIECTNGLHITIKRKCSKEKGHEGQLFGSITNKEISKELQIQNLYNLRKDQIILDKPIKTIGEYLIDIDLRYQFTKEFLAKKKIKDTSYNKRKIKVTVLEEK